MKFTICHDTSKKTLAIPRAALQLSGLEDAERLALHRQGCPLGSGQPVSQRYAVQKSVRGIPNL